MGGQLCWYGTNQYNNYLEYFELAAILFYVLYYYVCNEARNKQAPTFFF